RINRASQEVEPWLAESWTTSDDGRIITLTLRDDVRWSDGAPFSAADVIFSFETVYNPKAKAIQATVLTVDGQRLAVSSADDRHVIVTFPSTFGPGIRLLDGLPILPKHKLEASVAAGTFPQAWSADTPPSELAALGPFMLSRYDAGERVVFDRNPQYWRRDDNGQPLPYLDRVILDIVPDQNAELVRLQSGQADMFQQSLRAEDLAALRPLVADQRVELLELGVSTDPDAFFFNLRPQYWANDPRGSWLPRGEFRRAISHAVDREAFAETVFLAAAVPIHGPITPGNRRWFWPDLPRDEFSRPRALAALKSIGLENRDQDEWLEDTQGTEARFNVLTFRGNTVLERSAAVVRDELKQIGVAMDVVPLEAGALHERMIAGKFEAIFFNFTSDLDPAMNQDFWLSSGSAHIWHMSQPVPATDWERQMDALIRQQAATVDEGERRRIFREVQRLFAQHLPVIYFAAPRLYMGVSGRTGNLSPAPTRPHLLWSADTITVNGAASHEP
ncbi:MAG: ABC transporter substrate-binding protein, partial [Acidobacteria bacterium]|nr:ABC transporter substrate-binding protein [Acidobacteriota bacterium]